LHPGNSGHGLLVGVDGTGLSPETAAPAATPKAAVQALKPPPTSLQRRLSEYQQYQAREGARRAVVQQSRLRRLTGSGPAAGSAKAIGAGAAAGGTGTLTAARIAVRSAMAALVAAVAVTAATGDDTPAVSDSTNVSTTSASTSSSSATN